MNIMKLGVITDIHNNLTALRVVVERLNQMECDKIICCGDIIGIGPYPEETNANSKFNGCTRKPRKIFT